MKLGKRFARLKQQYNGNVELDYVDINGNVNQKKPHRKLCMMFVLNHLGGINKKAFDREMKKYLDKNIYRYHFYKDGNIDEYERKNSETGSNESRESRNVYPNYQG